MLHRQSLRLIYSRLAVGNTSLAFVSCGRSVVLNYLGDAAHWSLLLDEWNPVWARWRWARITNTSLLLTNTHPNTLDGTGGSVVTVPCSRQPDRLPALCQVGDSALGLPLVTDSTTGQVLGQHALVIDPDRTRSSLPPNLYFLLTDGRARWRKPANDGSSSSSSSLLTQANAMRIKCLSIAGVKICEHDMGHFDMSGLTAAGERDAIILGSSYWLANTTQVLLDGERFELSFVAAATATTMTGMETSEAALLWLDVALIVTVVLFGYSIWLTYDAMPNVGIVLWHLFESRSTATETTNEAEIWVLDSGMMTNLLLVLAATVYAALLVGLGYSYLPTTTVEGPYWQVLVLGLLCYSVTQVLLALVLAGVYPDRRTGHRWNAPSRLALPIAWLRHCTQGAGAAGLICCITVLVAFRGVALGSTAVVGLMIIPTLIVVYHNTYFVIGALAFAMARLPSLKKRHAHNGLWTVVIVMAVIELVLLLALQTLLVLFYIDPLVNTISPFFDTSWNFIAAIALDSVAMLGAVFVVLGEIRLVLVKVQLVLEQRYPEVLRDQERKKDSR